MPEALTSRLIDAADLAVAQINAALVAGLFVGLQFTVERSWASWAEELKVCDKLQVDCVGSRYDRSDLFSRERIGYQCSVEIYIRQRFGPNSLGQNNQVPRDTVDRLQVFGEELDVMFKTEKRFTFGDNSITWVESKILVAVSRPYLKDKQQFFGALRVTFDAPKIITPVRT